MALRKERSGSWRRFLGLSQDKSRRAVDILSQHYVEEMQQHDRLKQHAEKMHYPQFRGKLLQIASKKNEHAERIAQKILALGGKLPSVRELHATGENSWQQLLTALEEDYRSADHLAEQLRGLESEHSDVIVQQGKNLLACNGSESVDHSTEAEKRANQEHRR